MFFFSDYVNVFQTGGRPAFLKYYYGFWLHRSLTLNSIHTFIAFLKSFVGTITSLLCCATIRRYLSIPLPHPEWAYSWLFEDLSFWADAWTLKFNASLFFGVRIKNGRLFKSARHGFNNICPTWLCIPVWPYASRFLCFLVICSHTTLFLV